MSSRLTPPRRDAAIRGAVSDLLLGAWTKKDGATRRMRQSEIIIVASYNAQLNAQRDALPA